MTEAESRVALKDLFAQLGVRRGGTLYLGIDIGRLPLPRWPTTLDREAVRANREQTCSFLFDQLMGALGPDGTLLFPTFTYGCGNPANPFVVETTPSEVGPFTEWLRRHPRALRSIHPIFSVGAIGRHAPAIVGDCGGSAFGPLSPFGRLAQYETRFVNLGVPFSQSLTYIHHLEQCYGCNHRYHKVFATPVFKAGNRLPGPYLGYMRWRGVDVGPDVEPLERRLRAEGLMREHRYNGNLSQAADASDVDRVGYAMLYETPCAFASRPVQVDLDESQISADPVREPVAAFKLTL